MAAKRASAAPSALKVILVGSPDVTDRDGLKAVVSALPDGSTVVCDVRDDSRFVRSVREVCTEAGMPALTISPLVSEEAKGPARVVRRDAVEAHKDANVAYVFHRAGDSPAVDHYTYLLNKAGVRVDFRQVGLSSEAAADRLAEILANEGWLSESSARVVVCGSDGFTNGNMVEETLRKAVPPGATVVIPNGAAGNGYLTAIHAYSSGRPVESFGGHAGPLEIVSGADRVVLMKSPAKEETPESKMRVFAMLAAARQRGVGVDVYTPTASGGVTRVPQEEVDKATAEAMSLAEAGTINLGPDVEAGGSLKAARVAGGPNRPLVAVFCGPMDVGTVGRGDGGKAVVLGEDLIRQAQADVGALPAGSLVLCGGDKHLDRGVFAAALMEGFRVRTIVPDWDRYPDGEKYKAPAARDKALLAVEPDQVAVYAFMSDLSSPDGEPGVPDPRLANMLYNASKNDGTKLLLRVDGVQLSAVEMTNAVETVVERRREEVRAWALEHRGEDADEGGRFYTPEQRFKLEGRSSAFDETVPEDDVVGQKRFRRDVERQYIYDRGRSDGSGLGKVALGFSPPPVSVAKAIESGVPVEGMERVLENLAKRGLLGPDDLEMLRADERYAALVPEEAPSRSPSIGPDL